MNWCLCTFGRVNFPSERKIEFKRLWLHRTLNVQICRCRFLKSTVFSGFSNLSSVGTIGYGKDRTF